MTDQPSNPGSAERRARLAAGALFALVVAFGVWLRLDQLADQILGDDEWHALRYLLEHDYTSVFLHFGISDHCIPMTLLDKLVANTIGLDELAMRALPLASGLAALVVLPALLWPRFGAKTTLLFAALLAISPLHVYFTRYARPYAVVFLLGLVGVLGFERYLSTGRRRWAWTYVVCAILAPWFQPVMLPFVLAPPLFALLCELRDRRRLLARARELLPFALATGLGLLALIGPPTYSDLDTIRARAHLGHLERGTFELGYDLLSGTERTATALLFGAAVLVGLMSWLLRQRALLAYVAFVFTCGAGTLVYSMPRGIEIPIVAVRYAIPLLGIALLVAAEGFARIDEMLHLESLQYLPRHLPSFAACVAFVLFSPLLSPLEPRNAVYFRPNAWTNHALYQYQYSDDHRRGFLLNTSMPERTSKFYTQLGRRRSRQSASDVHLVEAPWCLEWGVSPFAYYQRIHRRPMSIGFVGRPGDPVVYGELPWPDERLRFRNFVSLYDLEGLFARGVTHVVLHKNLASELPNNTRELGLPIGPTVERYRKLFGPPSFEDENLVVFDLRARP